MGKVNIILRDIFKTKRLNKKNSDSTLHTRFSIDTIVNLLPKLVDKDRIHETHSSHVIYFLSMNPPEALSVSMRAFFCLFSFSGIHAYLYNILQQIRIVLF